MLQLLFSFLLIMLLTQDKSSKENIYEKAGKVTYEHFKKATNDMEMKRFLIANYQDPKDFEGLSRHTICEKMRMKATLTGKEYTRFPY